MPLFEKPVTEVVTPQDVRDLTGVSADHFGFPPDTDDPEKKLDGLLSTWIERIASHIHARLKRTVLEADDDYLAIQDILVRTVAKVVAVAQQQRASPIIQINDFAVSILNTSDVTKDLEAELRPYTRQKIDVFLA
ncbi:hypothetical protein B1691_12925 [Geobacillus sp. 47C-IIb]|jgi:hypothetical protein|uniref:hypothetical protein n=1 Tax=Geobacillus TaxID=129337 RepID=UPI00017E6F74|nr:MULTISPECIES: hypothetical protein [Geobacillus]OQP08932.1 hypothetical protein B1691_12925 [Geobacillus sp. 47C-IIb]PJW19289.1 hypothetical protein CV632_16920 [Geobacillus thermodenitrificans]QNU32366.1 hypothetical protein IC804_06490 [Geobacillus sp. 47C-IIb]